MNSIKQTLIDLTTVNFDCLPRANIIPKGNEQTIPETPMIIVSIKPPNKFISIDTRPNKPPLIRINAING